MFEQLQETVCSYQEDSDGIGGDVTDILDFGFEGKWEKMCHEARDEFNKDKGKQRRGEAILVSRTSLLVRPCFEIYTSDI